MEIHEVKLGDVAAVKGGKRLPKGINLITKPNTHPYIRVRDLNGKRTLELDSSFEFVDDETQKTISRYIVNDGDIVLSIVGTIGLVAIVGKSLNEANLTENCVKLTSLSGVDRDFLYYFLKSSYGQQEITRGTVGAVQAKLPIKNIQDITIPLPDELTQSKIAAVLSSLDTKIETNQKINDNLLAQAQAIFMQRFIMDKIEGDEKPLYDFADYINGAAFKPSECGDHGLPIIKIVELKNGITDSTKYFDGFKGEKYLIQDKDILFSWSGNPDTSIDIFIWTHGKAILNQHTFNVKSNTGHRWFTFLMLKYFKPEFSRIASNKQTTGLGHVTATDLKRLTFVFNKDAIEAFEHEVSPFMETIYTNMMENQRLEQLRDNLLPKLMSGEIDVSDIQL